MPRRSLSALLAALAALAVAAGAAACSKSKPAADKTVAPAAAKAEPAAVPAPEAVTAAAAPAEPATPTAAPAERKMDVSVALHIAARGKDAFALPTAGSASVVRVTPIDDKGQPVRDLEPVLGAQLALVAMRGDLGWVTVQRAVQLSDAARNTHDFQVTFPHGGSHVLYFLFKPKGAALASVPAFIRVEGKAPEAAEQPETVLRHAAKGGLEVQLALDPAQAEVCKPVTVATTWVRKGKQVRLAGAPDAAAVHYVAVESGLGAVAVARPVPAPVVAPAEGGPAPAAPAATAALGGDAGSEARFVFDRPGRYRILAVAEVAGRKAEVAVAHFAFAVGGAAPAGGCPPAP